MIVGLAILLRGGLALVAFDRFDQDPDSYRRIAVNLNQTGVYGLGEIDGRPAATAFRPPLYPVLLSCFVDEGQVSSLAVAILHTIFGAATVGLTLLIAQRLFERDRIDLPTSLAGILVAVDPILMQQSVLVMTETLASFLSVAVIWMWICAHSGEPDQGKTTRAFGPLTGLLGVGVVLALAYLCRPPFLVWAMLLSVAALFSRKGSWKHRVVRTVFVGGLVAMALLGWTYRNVRMMGHPVWATSHGGYTLLLANNDSFYDYLKHGKWGEAWDASQFLEAYTHRYEGDPTSADFWRQPWNEPAKAISDLSEPDDDRLCFAAARATILRQPKLFAWSCVVRCARLWSPMPHHTPGRSWSKIIAVGGYYNRVVLGCDLRFISQRVHSFSIQMVGGLGSRHHAFGGACGLLEQSPDESTDHSDDHCCRDRGDTRDTSDTSENHI